MKLLPLNFLCTLLALLLSTVSLSAAATAQTATSLFAAPGAPSGAATSPYGVAPNPYATIGNPYGNPTNSYAPPSAPYGISAPALTSYAPPASGGYVPPVSRATATAPTGPASTYTGPAYGTPRVAAGWRNRFNSPSGPAGVPFEDTPPHVVFPQGGPVRMLPDVTNIGAPTELLPNGTDDETLVSEEIIAPEVIADETKVVIEEIEDPAVIWESSIELGLNGSAGNSEIFNFRFGADAKRKTDRTVLSFDLDYKQDSKDSVTTANRLFVEGRNEWLLGESPWSIFVHGTSEVDEFRAFDSRLAADTGIGYQFIKTDITELKGRTGVGVSHEIGGPDDDYPAEATFGLNYTRQFTEKQKFSASIDYFPEFADFMNARITSKADWEILVDELWHMSLKFGLIDRYDSTPNGAKHNDIDYAVTLLWNF